MGYANIQALASLCICYAHVYIHIYYVCKNMAHVYSTVVELNILLNI